MLLGLLKARGEACAKPTQAWLDMFLNPLKSNECIFLLLDLCYCNVLSPPPGSVNISHVRAGADRAKCQACQLSLGLTLARPHRLYARLV